MKKILTDLMLRNAPIPASGRTELRDLACRGLSLRITPNGVRSWSFRYTNAAGKASRIALGRYPDFTLADARERADELRRSVVSGGDPMAEKRQARTGMPDRTFAALAARYLTEHAWRKKRSAAEDERLLRNHVLPKWADRPYAEIVRAEAVALVEGIITSGLHVTANRVGALLSKIFNFGIDAGLPIVSNPAARLARRGQETVKNRVLGDDEIRLFWRHTDASPHLSPQVGLALRLALLTGMRAGEVAELRRDELIDINKPATATILLPAARVKNKRQHLIPLAPLARNAILEALAIEASDFVFPSTIPGSSLENARLSKAMSRFAATFRASKERGAAASWAANPPTPHDLRRTLRTRLSALKVPREHIDAVMNHTPQDVGRKHYDQHDYLAEKRAALEMWERALAAILAGKSDVGKVVPMIGRRHKAR